MTFSELKHKLSANYEIGAITDEQLVQLIELTAKYLNLKTRTNKAKSIGKSYNGIKKFIPHNLEIDGVKFYIDNE